MPVAPESLYQTARDTYPPHFSRLSLRAFVNDAASRAQVDVEANFLARDRPNAASGSSGCRCARCLSLAQPPLTHPNLTSCVCRALSRRRRRSRSYPKPVLLSTPSAQIVAARARARVLFRRRARRRRGSNDVRRRRDSSSGSSSSCAARRAHGCCGRIRPSNVLLRSYE